MNLAEPSAAVAFGLGLWTAVQPCPMAANMAAVVWLGRRAGSNRGRALAALLFISGQLIVYVGMAWLMLTGLASSWRLSAILQRHVSEVLGPMWILTAMVLLELIRFRLPRPTGFPLLLGEGQRVKAWTALPLGMLLALAFCPVTAVLFFVNLITITIAGRSPIVYPALYAFGAALPVAAVSVLLGAGSRWLAAALNRTQQLQRWLNLAVGLVLLVVGIYYELRFNFAVWP